MATTVTLKPNAIDISGSTSGTTTLQATAVAGTTTLTLPAATDTLVGKATTDTLTNKTLTGAVMNGTIGATTPAAGSFTSVTNSGLTSGRVTYATTAGQLTDSANLTFNGTSLGVNSIASTGALSLASATSTSINLNVGATELTRLSANVNGIFTVGTEGSVSGLGSGYATLGAYGANGGGFKINRGTGAGTPSAIFYADSTGTFLGSAENSPLVFSTNNTEKVRITSAAASELLVGSTSALQGSASRGVIQVNGTSQSIFTMAVGGAVKGYLYNNGTDQTVTAATGALIFEVPSERMRIDSSGNVGIGTTSPAYKLDIQGTLGVTGAITPSQTAGIVGTTTNNNANAGSIGEVVSSSVAVGSAVALTTATTATSGTTVTSISLTAGDWDVFGTIGINRTAGTNFTVIAGGINTVNNELNALYEEQILFNYGAAGTVPLNTQTFALSTTRVSIASTTTYYLIAYAQFTVNTATGYGRITARRAR